MKYIAFNQWHEVINSAQSKKLNEIIRMLSVISYKYAIVFMRNIHPQYVIVCNWQHEIDICHSVESLVCRKLTSSCQQYEQLLQVLVKMQHKPVTLLKAA